MTTQTPKKKPARLSMFLLAPLFVIPPLFLFTAGGGTEPAYSGENTETELLAISSASEAFPGDCLPVLISSPENFLAAEAILANPAGKTIARVMSFESSPTASVQAPTDNHAPEAKRFYRQFMIGLSPSLENGEYVIEIIATGAESTVSRKISITILSRDFPNEDVFLDAQNTAIKTDYGPVRLAQIDTLNKLLFTQDALAPRFNGPYSQPVTATRRTSAFGERRTYHYPNGKKEASIHWGIDFGIPTGTPVLAAGDGRVVMSENRISTGLTVVIEHLPGVYSLYYHLDSTACTTGETVRTGTLIGKSGSTGLSTGPHLHWEFRVNGVAVSPDWFTGTSLWNITD